MSTKTMSLHEIHEWIDKARAPLTEGDEGVRDPKEILVHGDDDTTVSEIAQIRRKLQNVLGAVLELDLLFHDLFDCR